VGQGAPGTTRAQRPYSHAQGGSTSFAGIVAEGGLAVGGIFTLQGGWIAPPPRVTHAGSSLAIYRFGSRSSPDGELLGRSSSWRAYGAEPWLRIDPAIKWFVDTPSATGPPGGGGSGGIEGGSREGGDGGDGFAIIMGL